MSSGWADSALFAATHAAPPDDELSATQHAPTARSSWRRHLLMLVVVSGCLIVFMLARILAQQAHLAAEWHTNPEGQLELAGSRDAALRPHVGEVLLTVAGPAGQETPVNALLLSHSLRWTANDALRSSQLATHQQVAQALESGQPRLRFAAVQSAGPAQWVDVQLLPRGYSALGAMFWLLCAFAVVLYLVGWIVPLVQPQPRNLLYGLMALAQAGDLLLAAAASVPGLALPLALARFELPLHLMLDLVTGAAVVQAVTMHPIRLPHQVLISTVNWVANLGVMTLLLIHQLPHAWWWGQALLIADGLACIALLSWALKVSRHPFAAVVRRFAWVTVAALSLLTLAVALMPLLPPDVQPAAQVGPLIWVVFFASMILLVPFVSRSQNMMREFAMLAGISTIATSVDLLFVAVFSFSQFASLALSLFLALGAYAVIRQWLLSQMMGARALTTERMFQHLYRIAREVEARPERAAQRMVELLRNVFEPLEAEHSTERIARSQIAGNGALLLVPLPNLVDGPMVQGLVVLRFAERGSRLFTEDDARLADRILEQLMRALAHDRAVERGRSEERARIAQDLHDDIGARLLTLMYKAPSQEVEDYVRHTLQDLKTLTRGLAAKTHSLALASAEWKTDIAHRLDAARCELVWEASYDQDVTLTMVQWSSLTRILRELVSNVISHSHATTVRVRCQLMAGEFRIDVTDNGLGRNPSTWAHGLGLGGIRKRVKLMGGRVSWRDLQPVGIGCSVVIPGFCQPG